MLRISLFACVFQHNFTRACIEHRFQTLSILRKKKNVTLNVHFVDLVWIFFPPHWKKKQTKGLCIKVGQAQGDGGIRTRVWGLGTWGRETRDLRTSGMGRGDVWDGVAGTSYTGTQETQDVNDYCNESEVNAISLSSWKCVIYIMVNIRFHLPKPHWTPYTQNISL